MAELVADNGNDNGNGGALFSAPKVETAIKRMCAVMDRLDLTMYERWRAASCIERAAAGIMAGGASDAIARLSAALQEGGDGHGGADGSQA